MSVLRGRAWRFGDDIDTDAIVPGKYLISDAAEIARHVMEGVRPGFADEIASGDIIVGGHNFGTGSSRDPAVRALQAAGIQAIVAESFARIFYRNCINAGLAPIECPGASKIEEGQSIRVDIGRGEVTVEETGDVLEAVPLPTEIAVILEAGGLVAFLKDRLTPGR